MISPWVLEFCFCLNKLVSKIQLGQGKLNFRDLIIKIKVLKNMFMGEAK